MHFTPATAATILAFASSVFAAPYSAAQTSTAAPAPAPAPTLSLTQQLFLSDTAADRFKLLPDDKQFVFDFNQPQNNPGKGGELIAANRKTFPALVGTGSGMALGRVSACGMNTLHVHPRSAELQMVVKGRLITEMTPENGVVEAADGKTRRVIRTELGPFQMTPFYQGSIHSQFNPDCDDAVFVASFASEDFGTGQVADSTFAFSDDLIAATFGQSIAGEDIDRVRKAIPASIALGVEECLKKCNIKKRSL
ncbi:RmlC-like cupin [Colletotrichum eremochloae]|uniref:Putative cupin n=1 Tax=Colletotrichum sublineola TaxID=1173701 RepID=A0A066X8I9_COLSU|nr:RmlC-like cupin [Colletotrichum sublineola]KAK2011025.1 RmlC-like cupin [Colletotrichum eremochloae]KDN65232.1 putative cupin [Colletotrichum sublineola]